MAQARNPSIPAQVQTETEKPGVVLVEAVALAERMNDGRPSAGFFVRRRYHGDRFYLAKPAEFSPRWMRFVNEPPKEWVEKLEKIIKDQTIEDLMVAPPVDPRNPERPFSMGELQDRARQSHEMNYSTGKVQPRNAK